MTLIFNKTKKKIFTIFIFLIILSFFFVETAYTGWFSWWKQTYTLQQQLELGVELLEQTKKNPFFLNAFEFISISNYLENRHTLPVFEKYLAEAFLPHPFHFQTNKKAIVENITPFLTDLEKIRILEIIYEHDTPEQFDKRVNFFLQNFMKVIDGLDLVKFRHMTHVWNIENDFVFPHDFFFVNYYTQNYDNLKNCESSSEAAASAFQLLEEFKNPGNKTLNEVAENYYALSKSFIDVFFANPSEIFSEILKDPKLNRCNFAYSLYNQFMMENVLLSTDPVDLFNYVKKMRMEDQDTIPSIWFNIFNLITSCDFMAELKNNKEYTEVCRELGKIDLNSKNFERTQYFSEQLKKQILKLPKDSIFKQEFLKFRENNNKDHYYDLIEKYYDIKLR